MTISGQFEELTGRPFMDGYVEFPRLGIQGRVFFLLDTGADNTVLMPADAAGMDMPYGALAPAQETAHGIGGEARYHREPALLLFPNEDSLYLYDFDLEVAEPSEHNRGLPSLLGRDILNRWLMRYEAPRDLLEAEVDSADLVLPRSR